MHNFLHTKFIPIINYFRLIEVNSQALFIDIGGTVRFSNNYSSSVIGFYPKMRPCNFFFDRKDIRDKIPICIISGFIPQFKKGIFNES